MRVLVLLAMVLSPFWAPPAAAEQPSEKRITPMAFYESFNMRTIGSAMWQNLRAYCDSYPKDFFDISTINKNHLELVFDVTLYWHINFLRENRIHIYEAIYDGTWRQKHDFIVYYDAALSEWRAFGDIFAEKLNDCVPHPD